MAINKSSLERWKKVLASSTLPKSVKEYLFQCKITKIMISQAEKAWEIYFESLQNPDDNIYQHLNNFWTDFFGSEYNPKFHFTITNKFTDFESLWKQEGSDILSNLCQKIPSCRGWLAGASYEIKNNLLQIIVKQEIGWAYLTSHGIVDKLEKIIEKEYQIDVQIQITWNEENNQDLKELEEIENKFAERFKESIVKNKKEITKQSQIVSNIITGKKITGEPQEIKTLVEEEKSVITSGYVFNLEFRTLKTGRILVTFYICDKTDSLTCKMWADSDTAEKLQDRLLENKWFLFKGPLQYDKYSQELTLMPYDILETKVSSRKDNASEKRVELHLHTKMSALDALTDVKEIFKRAHDWGHEAVAITDHGVVQAFPEAYEAAKKTGVKPIYGVEGYLYNDHEQSGVRKVPTYHVIILALNQEGLRNLYELVTLSHLHHYYRVPRIPKSELARLRQGLLVGSACEAGELIRYYLKGMDEESWEKTAQFYDYLEIQPRGNNGFMINKGIVNSDEDLLKINKKIYELGQKLNKPVVATGDVHFLDPEDEIYRRIFMAGKGFDDADNQPPLYFKTTEEMLEEFAYLGEDAAREVVITNPQKIAALVDGEIKPIPDDLYPPEIPGAEEEIIRLTKTNAKLLYGETLPDIVQQRIDKELNSIINNGFAVLYLIAHKLVKHSNKDGYLVGSRGSVGSSLVATLCDITEVNSLPPHYVCSSCHYSEFITDGSVGSGADLLDRECPKCGAKLRKEGHDIPFEVFLGFKGDKVPDIDLNFSGDYQPCAHKFTEELFGKANVFRAGTIATIANKTAYGFVKSYYTEKGQVIRSAEVQRLVDGCTGVKRTTGQHPGGVMVLPKGLDIHKFTPLQRPADDVKSEIVTTHFDYHSISSRLVKLDILGHDDPTVIRMLEDLTGVDCKTIPLDEEKVLSLFLGLDALGISSDDLGSNVGTLGIPEFGTKFVRQMLEDTKPQNFSELVRISGFSHGTNVWLNNAQDLIKSGTAKMSEVISARDDIMLFLIQKGVESSQAFNIMERVRKGKGLLPENIKIMKAQNVPDWYIESCQKIKYMFPKAHAVAYVMMAFRIAYFKVYYPTSFYASFFSVRADEFDADIIVGGIPVIKREMGEITKKGNDATQKEKNLYSILELALEMYLREITLKHVNLLASDATRFLIVEEGKALLPPLVSLQGLGQTAAESIVKARMEKRFTSREDMRIRAKISKTVIEVLDNHGSLQDLPEDDQITLF